MVDCDVDGPLWVVLGRSWGRALCAVLGRSWDLCWRSWSAMLAISNRSWASTRGPGPLLVPLCAVLGCSWNLCWRSCVALGPPRAVLGCSWRVCWRSWAALEAAVCGTGPLLGHVLAVLGRSWDLSQGKTRRALLP